MNYTGMLPSIWELFSFSQPRIIGNIDGFSFRVYTVYENNKQLAVMFMNKLSNTFWNASLDEVKRGYVFEQEKEVYSCLVCGRGFEQGRIYSIDDELYEAKKAVEVHIDDEHGSMFHVLLGLDKEYTGFTEHQKNLLSFFFQGFNDKEITDQLGGSTSTIRNYRFTFREKEKQAKVLLAILELLHERPAKKEPFIQFHQAAKMVDDRYAVTKDEYQKTIQQYFPDGLDKTLSLFPKKEKKKLMILRHLAERFDMNTIYTEKEVNEILKTAYDDYVTLRRYLIEYGFMERKSDGSAYWMKK